MQTLTNNIDYMINILTPINVFSFFCVLTNIFLSSVKMDLVGWLDDEKVGW